MKLSDYLEANGLTAAAFGRRVSISRSHAARIMRGERHPRPEIMRRIHAATGGEVTANDFLHSEAA